MSRSYRKGYSGHCSTYGDKWCRFQYHKGLRAKDHRILKECEKFYRDCKLFEPCEDCCELNDEVCDVDTYYLELDDPHDADIYYNNLIDPEEILCNSHNKGVSKCTGCYYSENCWKDGKFFDAWEASPDEKFCNNRIDHSIRYSDKWSWASDGGVYYQESIASLRIDFDKEMFGEENNRYSHTNAWDDYCKFKQAKYNTAPRKWYLVYEIPTKETIRINWVSYYTRNALPKSTKNVWYKIESFWGDEKPSIYKYERCWETAKDKILLDHKPTLSDLPKNAKFLYSCKSRKHTYTQAKSDWDLMEFLFYRNIIPTHFTSREDLNKWLYTNEEKIVRKWYKIKNRK